MIALRLAPSSDKQEHRLSAHGGLRPPGRSGHGSTYRRSLFVLIDAEPARVADLAAELTDIDGVAEVYSVAGEVDLVAVIRVRHHDEMAEVVTGRIGACRGIRSTRSLIAFRSFSRHDLESMWDLGAT